MWWSLRKSCKTQAVPERTGSLGENALAQETWLRGTLESKSVSDWKRDAQCWAELYELALRKAQLHHDVRRHPEQFQEAVAALDLNALDVNDGSHFGATSTEKSIWGCCASFACFVLSLQQWMMEPENWLQGTDTLVFYLCVHLQYRRTYRQVLKAQAFCLVWRVMIPVGQKLSREKRGRRRQKPPSLRK